MILAYDLAHFTVLDLYLGDELIDNKCDFVALFEENVLALAYNFDSDILAIEYIEVGTTVYLLLSLEPQGLCLSIVLDCPSVDILHLHRLLSFWSGFGRRWLGLSGRCFLFLFDFWCCGRGSRC